MAMTSLTAKPLDAFSLGKKRILVCQVLGINPNNFVGKEFWFLSLDQRQILIKIDGLSTASRFKENLCDFSYSGVEISSDHIGADSLIVEAT